jgi:hypothetical protein
MTSRSACLAAIACSSRSKTRCSKEEPGVCENLGHSVRSDCGWMKFLGLRIGTNQRGFLCGFSVLSDAESMNFHCVPNQVLYQAEPLPDKIDGHDHWNHVGPKERGRKGVFPIKV